MVAFILVCMVSAVSIICERLALCREGWGINKFLKLYCIVDELVLKWVDGSNFFDIVWQAVPDVTGIWFQKSICIGISSYE